MSVYAPGQDNPTGSPTYNPRVGAGGWFAKTIQGATPKYAQNAGARGDSQHRNTLARIFVQVDPSEMGLGGLFLQSISDSQVRNQLAPRLTGANFDPNQQTGSGSHSGTSSGTSGTNGPTGQQAASIHTSGYLDFLITNAQLSLQEKVQVSETLSDNYVAFFFGQSAPMWPFSGMLINSVQDDQASNFFRLYVAILRGTQMARRQKSMSIRFDSFVANGVMTNIQLAYKSDNELLVPFSFNLLVKKVFITNYTANWQPTRADGAFAADPHVVASDGRPVESNAQTTTVASTPPQNTATPTGQGDGSDPRTTQPAPEPTTATALGVTAPNTVITLGPANNTLPASGPVQVSDMTTTTGSTTQGTSAYSAQPETVGAPGVTSNPDVRDTRPASTTGSPSMISATPG